MKRAFAKPRNRSVEAKRRQRRLLFELLERRNLLATVYVDVGVADAAEPNSTPGWFFISRDDPSSSLTIYFTMSGTATMGDTPPGDYDSFPLSVTIPAGFSEEYVNILPNDDSDDEGTETAILTITPSSNYTIATGYGSGTVFIADNDKNATADYRKENTTVCNCQCSCSSVNSGFNLSNGAVYISAAAGLMYDSIAASMMGVRQAIVTFGESVRTDGPIEITPSFRGTIEPVTYRDPQDLIDDQEYVLSIPVDMSGTPSGRYDWDLDILAPDDMSPAYLNVPGHVKVRNYNDSEFGAGWIGADLDKLALQTDGALWLRGDLNAYWFPKSGSTYSRDDDAPDPDFSTLAVDGSGYILQKNNGETLRFNSDGTLTNRTDRLGNATVYAYVDADGDFKVDEISSITDAAGRVTAYGYSGQLVETITDPFGRVTTLDHDTSKRLISITEPDPDGVGSLPAPVTSFTYGGGGLLSTFTDAAGNVTSYTYETVFPAVATITHPGGGVEKIVAQLYNTIEDDGNRWESEWVLPYPSDVKAYYTNEVNNTWTYELNEQGHALHVIDPANQTTSFVWDATGQIIQRKNPNPGYGTPSGLPTTGYGYSENRLASIEFPDATTQSWTYDSTFHQLTSYTDGRGNETLYTVDGNNGNITEVRQVVGSVDTGSGDDVVTTYTYTPHTPQTTDAPAGLVTSMTDSLGRVTTYDYTSRGLLETVTFAVGTADEATLEFGYDAYENLSWSEDELGRRTDYEFDALDRLIELTLPDPDGGGPLARPVYLYEYNKNNYLTKVTDPLGRVTEYVYNGRNDLVQIKQPDHDGDTNLTVTTLAYDLHRRLTSVTDPLGRATSYGYDSLDRQTSQTLPDPDGGGPQAAPVFATTYDAIGRIVQQTDALAHLTATSYAAVGPYPDATVTLPDPDGVGGQASPEVDYEFDANGNLVSETDPLGNVTTSAYDELNRLTSITQADPDGGGPLAAPVTTYAYDEASNLRFVTDPLGNVTEYQYDYRDRLVKVIEADPDGGGPLAAPETAYAYDDAGQLLTVTDAMGRETSYAYDALGRLLTITEPDPDGGGSQTAPLTAFAYDAAGRLIQTGDPLGNVTAYAYDALDNLTSITEQDPDGVGLLTSPVTTRTFDAAGQLLSVTDPLGRLTSYDYDNLGRLTKLTQPDPDGVGGVARHYTTYAYDAMGRLTKATDPLGHDTDYAYDNLGRRISTTDDLAGVTSFTYDAAGRMLTLTDPVENTTTWAYDNLGRVIAETNELSDTRSFEYDAAGNLTKKTDRLGRLTEYVYDNLYRLTTELWKSGGSTIRTLEWTYNAVGELTLADDPAATYSYTRDSLGRVTSEGQVIDGLTPAITYDTAYNAASLITQVSTTLGSDDDFQTDYTYDSLLRLTQITQQGQSGGNAVAEKRVDFAYNASGQFTAIDRYADLAGSDLVATSSYTYDGLGRLTELAHAKGVTQLAGYEYTYDAASRIASIDSYLDGLTEYDYDTTNQLVAADHTGIADESYEYDENGNRIMTGHTVGDNNQSTSDGTYDYEYDDEGNRTVKETISTGEREEYTWDHRNRLTKITFKDSLGAVVKTVDQTYDIFNRWIRRTLDSDGPGLAAAVDTFFSHLGQQIALEFDGTSDADLTHRYLWNPSATDQIMADETITSLTSAGLILWPLTDHLGTPRDLAEYNTGTNTTTVVNHRIFDSFGVLISQTNASFAILIGFTGRPYDDSTNLNNHLHRWYAFGQWLSEDPSGLEPDTNPLRYVGNLPTRFTDPSGLRRVELGPLSGWLAANARYYKDKGGFGGAIGAIVNGTLVGPAALIDTVYPRAVPQAAADAYRKAQEIERTTKDPIKASLAMSAQGVAIYGGAKAVLPRYLPKAPIPCEAAPLRVPQGLNQAPRTPRTGRYADMVDELRGTGQQANHLNQNAAYRGIIPEEDGLSHALRGNAFTEPGTPHFEFHRSLEGFWNQYRRGGTLFGESPTNAQYGQALCQALEAGGLSPAEAAELATQAARQRAAYGLLENAPVPNIPGRLPQKQVP